MRTFLSRVQGLVRRRALETRLEHEVRDHLERLAEDYERGGMTPAAARLAARRAFGGVEQMKEIHRDRRGLPFVSTIAREVQFAVRLLIRDRAFTATAVVALALGIAASNTIFAFVNGILFRDLPFGEPDRVVTIGSAIGESDRPNAGVSYLDLQDWRSAARTFDELGAALEMTMNVADDGRTPERFIGSYVSGNAFDVIGQAPVLGRAFMADDDRPGAVPVVMLGQSVWRNRYGSDRRVLGRTIRVNGIPSVVIGVMPDGFGFPVRSRVWQPLSVLPAQLLSERNARAFEAFGRISAGFTIEQARTDLGAVAATLARQHPETNARVEPRMAPFRQRSIGGRARESFIPLMAMVGFVLLIACANVANLLLARAAHRTREISLRLAIGASRMQIIRQLLVESVIVAALAGLVGLALSAVGIRVLWNAMTGGDLSLPYWMHFEMDWRVFTFLAGVCLATGVAFGIVPAIHASKTSISGMLSVAGGGAVRGRRWAGRFVVAQLALTPIVLTGAGLMMRSVLAQHQIDAGVETAGLVRMRLELTGATYPTADDRTRFYRQLEDRLASDTSLRATLASNAPFEGSADVQISIAGRADADPERLPFVRIMTIGRGYFEVMGTRAVRGRTFAALDGGQDLAPAIVNERFVEQHFGNQDPLGRLISITKGEPGVPRQLTVIGVAPDIRQGSTENSAGFDAIVYIPYPSNPIARANVMVRSEASPAAVASLVREHTRTIDSDLPLFDVSTLDESLAASDERMGLLIFGTMFTIFGGIALVLATVGLYAVTAYAASQRTREIGVRLALGAQARQIWWLVTERASRQLLIGLSIGMAGALGLGRLLRGLLIGTTGADPVTLSAVAGLLIAVTFVAALIPARRAMRVNPVTALRTE